MDRNTHTTWQHGGAHTKARLCGRSPYYRAVDACNSALGNSLWPYLAYLGASPTTACNMAPFLILSLQEVTCGRVWSVPMCYLMARGICRVFEVLRFCDMRVVHMLSSTERADGGWRPGDRHESVRWGPGALSPPLGECQEQGSSPGQECLLRPPTGMRLDPCASLQCIRTITNSCKQCRQRTVCHKIRSILSERGPQ